MVPLGFRLLENQLFREGDAHGVRIRLRPKEAIPATLLRFHYNASLMHVRWRIEGAPDGHLPDLKVRIAEREAGNESARAVEIPLNGPPPLTPAIEVVCEFIGLEPIRITRIERLT